MGTQRQGEVEYKGLARKMPTGEVEWVPLETKAAPSNPITRGRLAGDDDDELVPARGVGEEERKYVSRLKDEANAAKLKTIRAALTQQQNAQPNVFEHILIMESVLGRYLVPGERVHHKNGKHDDNSPENLELWRVKTKDPAGVLRASDYHCPGCTCGEVTR